MHSYRCQDKRFEGKYSGFAPRDVQNITLTILETHLRGDTFKSSKASVWDKKKFQTDMLFQDPISEEL